jgi:hypothetical protein
MYIVNGVYKQTSETVRSERIRAKNKEHTMGRTHTHTHTHQQGGRSMSVSNVVDSKIGGVVLIGKYRVIRIACAGA